MKRPVSSVSPAKPLAPPGAGSWPAGVLFPLLLAATLIVYLPCLDGEFLWDDAGHVTARALQSWSGLARIWIEPGATQQYYPLLHSAFWLEHRLWGDATLGYHLVNLLWHATSATLLITLLRRLAVPGASFAGFIFALHPVAVESVAWIAEQKNTLSTVFYLAAALSWLTFEQQRSRLRYAVATAFFAAGLLTKSVTATLPVSLLILAWWRHGRLSWRGDVAPLLPWVVLGATAGVGTTWLESRQIGARGDDFALAFADRTLLAGRAPWFYLAKLLWPADLAFFYPRWRLDPSALWQWLFVIATTAAVAAASWWSRRDRAPLAVALLFGTALAPVLGFVNVYPFIFSYVADHFQYLASLPVIAGFAAVTTQAFARLNRSSWKARVAASALLLILGPLTWFQSRHYRDDVALFEATIANNPSSWAAQLNLGVALADAGRLEPSTRHLRRALDMKPDHPETLQTLANVLNQLGRPGEALPLVEQALRQKPRFAEAANTRGAILMALGRQSEGISDFERAIALDPFASGPRINLAWSLTQAGRIEEALVRFAEIPTQDSPSSDFEYKWGLTLAAAGRYADAIPRLGRAVELAPENVAMRSALGVVLLRNGQQAEAEEQFQLVLQLDPKNAAATAALSLIQSQK